MSELRRISLDHVQSLTDDPGLCIKVEEDVETWKQTRSYRDYSIFLRRLTDSVVNYYLPWSPDVPDRGTVKLLHLLDTLDQWIEEIPPLTAPQRFGNLAFRTWGKRLEENCDAVLGQLLETEFQPILRFVRPYLMTSFGSFTRMDYGTGHETSFALFLLCLTLVRFFEPIPEVERQLVLVVFLRYLRLCWKLQDVYRLEPAGSHGVWGLDDSHFLPYIFGSGELRDQNAIPVDAVLQTPLPVTNLYFMAISRIHEVKHGPFFEHSSSLHSIAVGVPNWGKVNSGLFKMYEAEILSKRVVVQHIPLGGILEWIPASHPGDEDEDGEAAGGQKVSDQPEGRPTALAPTTRPPNARRAPAVLGGSTAFPQTIGTRTPWAASGGELSTLRSGDMMSEPQRFRVPATAPSAMPPTTMTFPSVSPDSTRRS